MQPVQFRAEWYIPNQVLYVVAWGEMSKEILTDYLKLISRLIDSTDDSHPLVHVISDFSRIRKQLGLIDTAQVMKSIKPNPKTGWTITIGETSAIAKMVSDIARQMVKVRQRSFDTVEEAIAFLHEVDESLDWSKVDEDALERARPAAEELQT